MPTSKYILQCIEWINICQIHLKVYDQDFFLLKYVLHHIAKACNNLVHLIFVCPMLNLSYVSLPYVSLPHISLPHVSLTYVSQPFVKLPHVSLTYVIVYTMLIFQS